MLETVKVEHNATYIGHECFFGKIRPPKVLHAPDTTDAKVKAEPKSF